MWNILLACCIVQRREGGWNIVWYNRVLGYCMVLCGIVCYCMLLYSFVWYCMVQQEEGGRLWNISNIKFLELLLYAATRPVGLHISDSFTQIQRKIEIQRTIEIQMQYLGNISNYFTQIQRQLQIQFFFLLN